MKNLSHHRQHQSSSTRQNDCKTAIVILSAGAHINACAILFFLPVSGVLDLTCFTFSGVTCACGACMHVTSHAHDLLTHTHKKWEGLEAKSVRTLLYQSWGGRQ